MPTALKSEKKDMETKRINISPKRQITIPQKFFTALGFEGEAECILCENHILIRPVRDGGGEFAEQILAELISQGYSGEQLLSEFKKKQREIRPAVEKMINEAKAVAQGKKDGSSYSDLFDEEE
jgi:hypothetical protein